MPSPFPGMNPYLEKASIWEDFHQNITIEIQSRLSPSLRPRYYAAVVPRVTYEEIVIEDKPRNIKPDVSIFRVSEQLAVAVPVALPPAPVIGAIRQELPVNQYTIEIRETEEGTLVTAIEILSPVNKRPGHEAYLEYHEKRRALFRSAAHLLEIDLLRAGRRPPLETPWPDSPYAISLSRRERRPNIEIWPLRLQDPIPPIPVPLRAPDPDVPLEIGAAIHAIYDRAGYDLRIDYTQPPPKPDLPQSDAEWVASCLRSFTESPP